MISYNKEYRPIFSAERTFFCDERKNDGGWALNHFSCRNLIGHGVGQNVNNIFQNEILSLTLEKQMSRI